MAEQKIDYKSIDGFSKWVHYNYGYSVSGGLWNHSLKKSIHLSVLQTWFREEHKNYIEVVSHLLHIDAFERVRKWYFYLNDEKIEISYKTYEEALEEGLKEALKRST